MCAEDRLETGSLALLLVKFLYALCLLSLAVQLGVFYLMKALPAACIRGARA